MTPDLRQQIEAALKVSIVDNDVPPPVLYGKESVIWHRANNLAAKRYADDVWPLIESALAQAEARAVVSEDENAELSRERLALRAEVARLTAALAQARREEIIRLRAEVSRLLPRLGAK